MLFEESMNHVTIVHFIDRHVIFPDSRKWLNMFISFSTCSAYMHHDNASILSTYKIYKTMKMAKQETFMN